MSPTKRKGDVRVKPDVPGGRTRSPARNSKNPLKLTLLKVTPLMVAVPCPGDTRSSRVVGLPVKHREHLRVPPSRVPVTEKFCPESVKPELFPTETEPLLITSGSA